MKIKYLLLILIISVFSCSGLPEIQPLREKTGLKPLCTEIFPCVKMEFVHSIEASLPNGKTTFMIGVTIVSPQSKKLKCSMMTLEGFVLFDADFDGRLVINRAVPPFDSPGFGQGIIDDIKLIFFKPDGVPLEKGRLKTGIPTCRFHEKNGQVIDIMTQAKSSWKILKYDKDSRIIRTVEAFPGKIRNKTDQAPMIPGRLVLTAHGLLGYKLSMKLIEAERINP